MWQEDVKGFHERADPDFGGDNIIIIIIIIIIIVIVIVIMIMRKMGRVSMSELTRTVVGSWAGPLE